MDRDFERDIQIVLGDEAHCKKELHALYCLCFDCFGLKQGMQDQIREQAFIRAEYAATRRAAAGGAE